MSQPEQQETMGKLAASITSEIVVFVVVILFIIFVVIFFLYLHAKHYPGASPFTATQTSQIHVVLAQPGHPHRALDPAVLSSLPVAIFNASKKTPLECSVCLCELSDGEKARVLPSCGHGFHVQCIDMWFLSNNTCPLCRTLVSESRPPVRGLNTEGSSSGPLTGKEGTLVIEIPRRVLDLAGVPSTSSPLPLSRHAAMQSPLSGRLSSLRRILSGRNIVVGAECTCSSEGADMV